MSSEVFEALSLLEKERGIPVDFMLDKIKKAILTACKSSYNGNDDAIINMNPDTGVFEVYLQKTVVEEVEDKGREISLLDAREIDPNTAVGEKVGVQLDTKPVSYTHLGHMNLDKITEAVKIGVAMGGGTPVVFPAIAVCDGIAMGHQGMKYSLVTRDLIADSTEAMAIAHAFDALVTVSYTHL